MVITLDMSSIASDATMRRALTSLSTTVAKSKRVVVVTGAGISCSSGIPDFRSSDGLYAFVKAKYPDVVMKGRDLFDAALFRDPTSTALFYTFMAELKASIDLASPSPTHHFIKTLDTKGKLLRSYTQNIDGLEARVGLACTSSEDAKSPGRGNSKIKVKGIKNIQLHGDIHRVRCMLCAAETKCDAQHLQLFREGTPPDCQECKTRSEERRARSARALKIGTLRPAIVLYDESHPLGDDIGTIQTSDLKRKPDLLIIMGTSLKVHGLRKLVKEFTRVVHEHKSESGKVIFVNKTPPATEWDSIFDYYVSGDTDTWVSKVLEDWKKSRPQDWEIQKTLFAGGATEQKLMVVKRSATTGTKAKLHKNNNSNAENIPPSPLPFAGESLPTPPVSPSKRKSNNDPVECSPSKKRGGVLRPTVPASERGALFTIKKTVSVTELVSKMDKPILRTSSKEELDDVF
ncbi:hypothetical protein Clacol_004016 [Clathrus columnatus]|uniref:Deacetylase sirtuin-type domain-containing protein n=1 Tax=Clathrus columnatus TaxID=1419009 RepID=A0AAV5A8F5_9AGAM|nr:hypothetical protein Clacol_004016 [Clathrus columnatus]